MSPEGGVAAEKDGRSPTIFSQLRPMESGSSYPMQGMSGGGSGLGDMKGGSMLLAFDVYSCSSDDAVGEGGAAIAGSCCRTSLLTMGGPDDEDSDGAAAVDDRAAAANNCVIPSSSLSLGGAIETAVMDMGMSDNTSNGGAVEGGGGSPPPISIEEIMESSMSSMVVLIWFAIPTRDVLSTYYHLFKEEYFFSDSLGDAPPFRVNCTPHYV